MFLGIPLPNDRKEFLLPSVLLLIYLSYVFAFVPVFHVGDCLKIFDNLWAYLKVRLNSQSSSCGGRACLLLAPTLVLSKDLVILFGDPGYWHVRLFSRTV